jgi:hypothetical protein
MEEAEEECREETYDEMMEQKDNSDYCIYSFGESLLSCPFSKILKIRINKTKITFVLSEVLTPVVIKSSIVWDVRPCSQLEANLRFEEHIAPIFRVEE